MSIYPNMFEETLIEKLLKKEKTFEDVRNYLDEFSYMPDSSEEEEMQEE